MSWTKICLHNPSCSYFPSQTKARPKHLPQRARTGAALWQFHFELRRQTTGCSMNGWTEANRKGTKARKFSKLLLRSSSMPVQWCKSTRLTGRANNYIVLRHRFEKISRQQKRQPQTFSKAAPSVCQFACEQRWQCDPCWPLKKNLTPLLSSLCYHNPLWARQGPCWRSSGIQQGKNQPKLIRGHCMASDASGCNRSQHTSTVGQGKVGTVEVATNTMRVRCGVYSANKMQQRTVPVCTSWYYKRIPKDLAGCILTVRLWSFSPAKHWEVAWSNIYVWKAEKSCTLSLLDFTALLHQSQYRTEEPLQKNRLPR